MNPLFHKLEPLRGSDHCWYYFDDEQLCLQVPCDPRPKGSASPVARKTKEGKAYIAFIPGSDSSGIAAKKMKEQESKIRDAVACLWRVGFRPYDAGCVLDLDCIFLPDKSRSAILKRTEETKHLIYPDRDKLLRAVQDMISPPVKNRNPQLDQPHLVVNDSQIYDGRTTKWWLETWNKENGLNDDESSVYISLSL